MAVNRIPQTCRQTVLQIQQPAFDRRCFARVVENYFLDIRAQLDANDQREDKAFRAEMANWRRHPIVLPPQPEEVASLYSDPKSVQDSREHERFISDIREQLEYLKRPPSPSTAEPTVRQKQIVVDAAKVEAFAEALFAQFVGVVMAAVYQVQTVVLVAASQITALYLLAVHDVFLDRVVPKVTYTFEKTFPELY